MADAVLEGRQGVSFAKDAEVEDDSLEHTEVEEVADVEEPQDEIEVADEAEEDTAKSEE